MVFVVFIVSMDYIFYGNIHDILYGQLLTLVLLHRPRSSSSSSSRFGFFSRFLCIDSQIMEFVIVVLLINCVNLLVFMFLAHEMTVSSINAYPVSIFGAFEHIRSERV